MYSWEAIISRMQELGLRDGKNPDMGQGDSISLGGTKERPHHSRRSRKGLDIFSFINEDRDTGSDDDLFTNEKVDTSRLLSVEGKPIPDPNYVAGQMASEYHALINLNYKKDCRSWLYKNKQSREKVRSILNEVSSRRGNARR